MRTLFSFLLGAAAASLLACTAVLVVGGIHVLSPERPLRVAPVLLGVPEVREELAQEVVGDLEEDRGLSFTDPSRVQLVDAVADALGSARLHRELSDLRPVGGRVDGSGVVATLSDVVRSQAAGQPPDVRRALEEIADRLPRAAAEEGSSFEATQLVENLTDMRRYTLVAASMVAVPGLVLGALAVAVARRRSSTVVVIASGALLLAALVLAPGRFVLEHLPGPLSIPGHLLAAIGELSGPGTLWALVLASAVPAMVRWAVGQLRSVTGEAVG